MSDLFSSHTRRAFLAASAAAGAVSLLPAQARSDDGAIRPFRINIPDDALADLRRRIAATRWPDRETVTDQSQGAQLAQLQELARYWGTDYDWRKIETRLNALPQFMTTIDGVDIHFIHVRSRHPNALPVVVTHGWPGSIIEQLKIIAPLTEPSTADAPRTPSMSSFRPCRAMVFPAGRRAPVGNLTVSHAPGQS